MAVLKNDPRLHELAELLRRRIAIIGDHALRERDAEAHLNALRTVSEDINRMHTAFCGTLPPRLEHFMSGCSYQKALAFIEDLLAQ